ncbi:MAG TPA: hypothetical protein VIR79_03510 [Nitrospira sp.]|jgi:hypothetical protein|nr:hypothetical protein [Gammaproteobacteria bacterium]MDH3862476.1 hypothetical protein [Gammaproteobacteria bacterium]MDH3904458.1 hypothetical protein [Gammaproteobacteria bacterium]MDH3953784.1 hypothetical protein [Gammaproteobacteria bacterium]MDH3982860.1 hypothetical protein [Gammaproteobacteria bacterium]
MADRREILWVQVPGWLLLLYLIVAQGPAAFDYEIGVRMGTQEPAASITEVGAAFWYGFAFADLVVYIPLLAAGLLGYWRNYPWGRVVLGAALGITVYWPAVVLAAAVDARDASGWAIDETPYLIVLPVIAVWAVIALIQTTRSRTVS